MARKATPGVLYVHSRECSDRDRCAKNCNPSAEPWQAWVFDSKYVDPATGKRGKKIRRRFATHAAAKGWRTDAGHALRNQKLKASDAATARKTLAEEVADWLAGARAGEIVNKREKPYKPAVLRNYELSLRLRVLPALGDQKLSEIRLTDLLALKEQLQGQGVSGSTIRNSFVPLAAIYRRARIQGRVMVDPTTDLPLPTSGRRDRAATPTEAEELLTMLPESVEALWAGAFYSGLRRGELRALRVRNVDLEAGTIAVEHSWDEREGEIAPKSEAGTRTVFVADALRPYLEPLVEGRSGEEFVFGGLSPFDARAAARRAERALEAVDEARAKEAAENGQEAPDCVQRFTLHEARHSFSTWLDHASVSPDRADRYMGHSSGSVASRYRHLLPAQLQQDRRAFDAYVRGAAVGKIVALAAG
ncbi:MAG TPA: tyrosine-type recombinase/integrase [Gaiellaceae bacterium]|nr:tyrosine-type recombinase/integrase [Gaiellaceae bacterium]